MKEKSCVLAEELGHFYTSSGDILDTHSVNNQKQELKARLWAYDKQIGLSGIIETYKRGCYNMYDMAEHLEVSENFLKEAIICYKGKYGKQAIYGKYIIYFKPYFWVCEIF